jgi:hypothetical protein
MTYLPLRDELKKEAVVEYNKVKCFYTSMKLAFIDGVDVITI